MNSLDERTVALSKKKIAVGILGAGAFVAIGVWMLSLDEARILSSRGFRLLYNNPMIVHGLGLASIVVFGFLALFFFKKLFDKKPGLVFNSAGIVDNASAVAAGFIPWSEVIGSQIFEMHNQKMLVILVKDPEKYVDSGNALKRTINRANYKMCGSPISISSTTLQISFSELQSLFDEYHQKRISFAPRLQPADPDQ